MVRVRIPPLPVEERRFRHRSRRRQSQRNEHRDRDCGNQRRARPVGQPRQQHERSREDEHAAAERVSSGEERRRPPGRDQNGEDRGHGTSGGDGGCNESRECEDGKEQQHVHARVCGGVNG